MSELINVFKAIKDNAELGNTFVLGNKKNDLRVKSHFINVDIDKLRKQLEVEPGLEAFGDKAHYHEALRKAESDINNYDPIRLAAVSTTQPATPGTTAPAATSTATPQAATPPITQPAIPKALTNRINRGLIYDLGLAETKKDHAAMRHGDLDFQAAMIQKMGEIGVGESYKGPYAEAYNLKWAALDKYASSLEKRGEAQKEQDKLYVQFKEENIQEKWVELNDLKKNPEGNKKEIKELEKLTNPFFNKLSEVRNNIKRQSRDMSFANEDVKALSKIINRVGYNCTREKLDEMISTKNDYKRFQKVRDDIWVKYDKAYDAAGKILEKNPNAEEFLKKNIGEYKNRNEFATRDDLESDARVITSFYAKAMSNGAGPRSLKVLANEAEKYKLGTEVRNGLRDNFRKELTKLSKIDNPTDRQKMKADDARDDYELVRDILKDAEKNPQRTAYFRKSEKVDFGNGNTFKVEKSDFDILKTLQGARNDIQARLEKSEKFLNDPKYKLTPKDEIVEQLTPNDPELLKKKEFIAQNKELIAFHERNKVNLTNDYNAMRDLVKSLKGSEKPPLVTPGDRKKLEEIDKKLSEYKVAVKLRDEPSQKSLLEGDPHAAAEYLQAQEKINKILKPPEQPVPTKVEQEKPLEQQATAAKDLTPAESPSLSSGATVASSIAAAPVKAESSATAPESVVLAASNAPNIPTNAPASAAPASAAVSTATPVGAVAVPASASAAPESAVVASSPTAAPKAAAVEQAQVDLSPAVAAQTPAPGVAAAKAPLPPSKETILNGDSGKPSATLPFDISASLSHRFSAVVVDSGKQAESGNAVNKSNVPPADKLEGPAEMVPLFTAKLHRFETELNAQEAAKKLEEKKAAEEVARQTTLQAKVSSGPSGP